MGPDDSIIAILMDEALEMWPGYAIYVSPWIYGVKSGSKDVVGSGDLVKPISIGTVRMFYGNQFYA